MSEYRVVWRVDIEAGSAYEAATMAAAMCRTPDSTATCYEVITPEGGTILVDLDAIGDLRKAMIGTLMADAKLI